MTKIEHPLQEPDHEVIEHLEKASENKSNIDYHIKARGSQQQVHNAGVW